MKKSLISFIIMLLFAFLYIPSVYANLSPSDVNAPYAILIDLQSGQVLFEKNSDVKAYPASTTKIMTGILALEYGNLDKVFTASAEAVNTIEPGGMIAGIKPGEEVKLEDLINVFLVKSANECGNIIAEGIAGSVPYFAELMNKKAREIGAVNTNFVNPHGLHDPDHYTTAGDLAKIARYAMKMPAFRKIVAQDEYILPPTNMNPNPVPVYTTNKFVLNVQGNPYYTSEALGIKTGYTDEAMSCLVSGMSRNGMELIAVVLKERDSQSVYEDSLKMFNYGFKNYSNQKLASQGLSVAWVPVLEAADAGSVELVTGNEVVSLLPNDRSLWNIREEQHINPDITAPVQAGDVLGSIEYYQDEFFLGKTTLISATGVLRKPEPKTRNVFTGLVNTIFNIALWAALSLAFFILSIPIIRKVVKNIQKSVRARNG